MMTVDNRFWILVAVLSIFSASNSYISFTSVKLNHERISTLEKDAGATLLTVAHSSRETSEKVVEALTGLTKVIGERSQNDHRILELLEEIYTHSQGEKNGK